MNFPKPRLYTNITVIGITDPSDLKQVGYKVRATFTFMMNNFYHLGDRVSIVHEDLVLSGPRSLLLGHFSDTMSLIDVLLPYFIPIDEMDSEKKAAYRNGRAKDVETFGDNPIAVHFFGWWMNEFEKDLDLAGVLERHNRNIQKWVRHGVVTNR